MVRLDPAMEKEDLVHVLQRDAPCNIHSIADDIDNTQLFSATEETSSREAIPHSYVTLILCPCDLNGLNNIPVINGGQERLEHFALCQRTLLVA